MITVLASNSFGDNLGDGVAGPLGLLIIVLLAIGTVLLIRSMNKHLRRIPESFPDPRDAQAPPSRPAADAPPAEGHPAEAAGEVTDTASAQATDS